MLVKFPLPNQKYVYSQVFAFKTNYNKDSDSTGELSISGEGESEAKVTHATASVNIKKEAKTASEARQAASATIASVLNAIKALNASSIKTSGYNVAANYVYNHKLQKNEHLGYIATNTITFRAVIEKAVSHGERNNCYY